jgi:hypothetical protein
MVLLALHEAFETSVKTVLSREINSVINLLTRLSEAQKMASLALHEAFETSVKAVLSREINSA